MQIYIPSRGRPDRQITAEQLKSAKVPFRIVCTKGDSTIPAYRKVWGKQILVVTAKNLSEKRQAIIKHHRKNQKDGRLVMLDDDLSLWKRKKDGAFKRSKSKDVRRMFKFFKKALKTHAHAGVIDKFMSQGRARGEVYSGRYSGILGYNVKLWPRGVSFRTVCNQEHDVHLQLATKGFPPCVTAEFSRDNVYYAAGGCSAYRTPAFEKGEHLRLAKLWPDFVTVRPNKHSRSGVGIKVKWKKAIEKGETK